MIESAPELFAVPFKQTQLIGDRWRHPSPIGEALLLHGGGTSSGQGFQELRTRLLEARVGSVAFDFIGHGRTGGALSDSSLADRVQQTLAVADHVQLDPATTGLLGFSMGAYVAVRTIAAFPVRHLGLAIPAAYVGTAFELPFGPSFSAAIRVPLSWQRSDAFDIISRFTGRLLVLSAGEDQVVPAEIPARYFESAGSASRRTHHVIEGAPHRLDAHYQAFPASRIQAYERVAALWPNG